MIESLSVQAPSTDAVQDRISNPGRNTECVGAGCYRPSLDRQLVNTVFYDSWRGQLRSRATVSFGVVPGADKQVSMYLDGVYLSSPRGAIFDLPNVERIEMLRGPQGTLFGRNAIAGAISISTRDPMVEGHVKAGISMFNHHGWR